MLLRNVPICGLGHLGSLNRKSPGAIDMADHGERAAVRMGEQASRQCGDEWLRRQRRRFAGLRKVHQELIGVGRAGAEAGEQQRDDSVDIGVVGDVGGGQEVLGLRTLPKPGQSWHSSAPWVAACAAWPDRSAMPCEAVNSIAGGFCACSVSSRLSLVASSPSRSFRS